MAHKSAGDYPTAKQVLLLVGAGILLSAAILVAPGLGFATAYLRRHQKWGGYNEAQLRQTTKRLMKAKLISVAEKDGETVLKITNKGKERILKYKVHEMVVGKPEKWDGKWRLVIFDIPNEKKRARELFRSKLKDLGFYPLQESVFLHPFPCKDQIEFLRNLLEIQDYVEVLAVTELENDEFFRSKFDI